MRGTGGAVIPAGSLVVLEVASVEPADPAESGAIVFRVRSLDVNSTAHASRGSGVVRGDLQRARVPAVNASDRRKVVTGAVAGAILGRVLGGDARGAVIGAAAGGAAGERGGATAAAAGAATAGTPFAAAGGAAPHRRFGAVHHHRRLRQPLRHLALRTRVQAFAVPVLRGAALRCRSVTIRH